MINPQLDRAARDASVACYRLYDLLDEASQNELLHLVRNHRSYCAIPASRLLRDKFGMSFVAIEALKHS